MTYFFYYPPPRKLHIFTIFFLFIQGEKIQALLNAAGVTVEPFWPGMFAKALEGRNIGDLLCSIGTPGSGGGGAAAGGAAAGGGDSGAAETKEEAKEEKKEESEESDDDMGFGKLNGDCLGHYHLQSTVNQDQSNALHYVYFR